MTVLAQAAAPTWTNKSGILNWSAVSNATGYTVVLTQPGWVTPNYTVAEGSTLTFIIPSVDMSRLEPTTRLCRQ